jgi:hypothetical protein
VKEELFWHNYFAHVYAVRQAILYSRLDKEEIDRASNTDSVGKRNLEEELIMFETSKDNDGAKEDVVELSSLSFDGMSLEDQINAALMEDP